MTELRLVVDTTNHNSINCVKFRKCVSQHEL